MQTPHAEWIGRLDPDGRFALWKQKRRKSYAQKIKEVEYFQGNGAVQRMLKSDPTKRLSDATGFCEASVRCLRQQLDSGDRRSIDPKGLGSSKQFNSEKPRMPRGTSGITPHGRRLVRNGVGLMESRFGKGQLTMFTGTFPPMTPEDESAIVKNWATGINLFVKNVQYRLANGGVAKSVVGCIEIQMLRHGRTGEMGLHVHLVWVGRKRGRGWIIDTDEIQKIWSRTWQNHLQQEYKWDAATQLARIVKSASAYLGKYLSKGSGEAISTDTMGIVTATVSAWYVCSHLLRKWVGMSTIKSAEMGQQLKEMIRSHSESILFCSSVDILIPDGRTVPVVYFGTSTMRNFGVIPPV